MEGSSAGPVARAVAQMIASVRGQWTDLNRAKQALMRPDGETQYAIDRGLDEALRELGAHDPRTSWFQSARTQLKAKLVRPEWIDKDHVRQWLSQAEVQVDLKRLARTTVAGGKPDDALLRSLQDRLSLTSGEDRQHAE